MVYQPLYIKLTFYMLIIALSTVKLISVIFISTFFLHLSRNQAL